MNNVLLLFLLSINFFSHLKMAAICNYTEEEQWPRLNHRVGEDNEPSLMIWKHPILYSIKNNMRDTAEIEKNINTFIQDIQKQHPNETLCVVISLLGEKSTIPRNFDYKNFLITLSRIFTENDIYNAYIDPYEHFKHLSDSNNNIDNHKKELDKSDSNQKTYITICSEGNFCFAHRNNTNSCVTYTDIKEKIKQHTQNKDLHTILAFPFPKNNLYHSGTGYDTNLEKLLEQYWPNQNAGKTIYTNVYEGKTDTEKNKKSEKEKDYTENFKVTRTEGEGASQKSIDDEFFEKKNYWQMIIQKICDNGTFIGAGFGIVLIGGIAAYLFLRHKA
jgi:hypothetical protein